MTQFELADIVNVTRQTISKYERGESFPEINILLKIAEIFCVSAENLINAGEAAQNESEILLQKSLPETVEINEVINIAPLIKPSVLDKLIEPLKKQKIEISHIIALSEYLNTKSVDALMEGTDLNKIAPEVLKYLIPYLNEEYKTIIFGQILDGTLNWSLMDVLSRYMDVSSLLENMFLEGFIIPDNKGGFIYD
jgi:transcriptional regulator with XRE-family HTH domain